MMKLSIPTIIVPLLFLLFSNFTQTITIPNCPEIEKNALLTFKHYLQGSPNSLSSWNGKTDCCKWSGVVCNNLTGHVHQLHLQGYGLSGKLDPSLLNLKNLRYLDLTWNNFQGTIPSFLGSFANLEYLDLTESGFSGIIPHLFGNLSNLQTLKLDSYMFFVDNLEWLSKLSRLEDLSMNYVGLEKASNWAQVINTLPSLKNLSLKSCGLDFSTSFNGGNVSKSLIFLDLSDNGIGINSSVIPSWIFQISSLVLLDLSNNQLIGSIPIVANITKLHYLDLSCNEISSTIPSWFYLCYEIEFVSFKLNALFGAISDEIENLTSLENLEFSFNKLSGNIPRGIVNLYKMKSLDLSRNYLQGLIPDSLGKMLRLESLRLDYNKLSGGIPQSVGNLSSLGGIDLRDNELTGNLPESWGQLLSLAEFDVGNNMLEGVVTERHFANLTSLTRFLAAGNNLTLNVSPNWIPTFELESLGIGSWNLGEDNKIPLWIQSQKSIGELDLSNSGIVGTIPDWFWNFTFLDLSNNQFHGNIINGIGFKELYLGSNQFEGPLPRLADVLELDLSNNSFSEDISQFVCDDTFDNSRIQILHLGGNQLSGKFPDCWEKWPSLKVLNLENNNISGSIPNSLAFLQDLKSLNLHGNKLFGHIPFTLFNCTMLLKIDLSDNKLEGNMPAEIGIKLPKLRFLVLSSNKLSGAISSYICQLSSLQILDLSDNMFVGTIPDCVGNFTAMASKRGLVNSGIDDLSYSNYSGVLIESASINTKGRELLYDVTLSLFTSIDLSKNNFSGRIPKELTSLVELRSLNLSGNHLIGRIPNTIGDMKQLESLDLSRNFLSGGIPESFKTMSSLSYLNMSHNNLTGRIPESTQIGGLDPSSFAGNDLCGPPLSNSCSNDPKRAPNVTTMVKVLEKRNIQWLYVFISLGFAMGLSSFCSALVLNKSWRETYFEFLEDLWDGIYVRFNVVWRKVTAKCRGQVPRG